MGCFLPQEKSGVYWLAQGRGGLDAPVLSLALEAKCELTFRTGDGSNPSLLLSITPQGQQQGLHVAPLPSRWCCSHRNELNDPAQIPLESLGCGFRNKPSEKKV